MSVEGEIPAPRAPAASARPRRVSLPRPLAPWSAATRKVLGLVAVALVGATIGWSLAPTTTMTVGPLDVRVAPQLRSGPATVLELPPVGDVTFASHSGPLALDLSVESIDLAAAEKVISSPEALTELQRTAPDAATAAVVKAVAIAIGSATLAALLAGYLIYRRPRRALQCGAVALAPLLVVTGVAAASFDPRQLSEPTFTGLLSRAPYILQEGVSTADRLESYRSGVHDITQSVTTLYATANQLPGAPVTSGPTVTTVLHVSDIHLNPQSFDLIRTLVEQFDVKVVIDTGDITTWGTPLESQTVAPIGSLGVPYVFVRGNHDSAETAAAVAALPNAIVLDDSTTTVAGLTVSGIGDFTFTPDGEGNSRAQAKEAANALARTINSRPVDSPPVDIALIHNPTGVAALSGDVPLVLSGHMHTRAVRLEPSGTRVMVEGSTGGAGVSTTALANVAAGHPLPLEATLLYFAEGPSVPGQPSRQRLVAYDEVTVGGLGLASVSIERTTISADDKPTNEPLPDVTPVDRPPASASATGESVTESATDPATAPTESNPKPAPRPRRPPVSTSGGGRPVV